MSDFSEYLIKEYEYWTVSAHPNQGYLGRCIIWCKRENAFDLCDATAEEYNELLMILKKIREAAKTIFQADWFNYAFLGNGTRHLHGHFIPRYSSSRNFEGETFSDELWGHNYKTNHDFVTKPEIFEAVKKRYQKELE